MVSAVVYMMYLLPTLMWLSKQMEFEADWFSVMSDLATDAAAETDENQRDNLAGYDSMTLAIARLAAHSPEQFERRTLMHPSLKERMRRTSQLADHRISAQQLIRITSRRVWFIRSLAAISVAAFLISTVIFS